MKFPERNEYPPFFQTYISHLAAEGTDVLALLRTEFEEQAAFLEDLDKTDRLQPYAEGKWSVKEVVGHLIDCELIFMYRALRAARGDQTTLPGFDENAYVPEGKFDARSMASLLEEWRSLRQSLLVFGKNLAPETHTRYLISNENKMSVSALFHITLGHGRHHIKVIKARYL